MCTQDVVKNGTTKTTKIYKSTHARTFVAMKIVYKKHTKINVMISFSFWPSSCHLKKICGPTLVFRTDFWYHSLSSNQNHRVNKMCRFVWSSENLFRLDVFYSLVENQIADYFIIISTSQPIILEVYDYCYYYYLLLLLTA